MRILAFASGTTLPLGLKVLPWTVNDRADLSRLVDPGVDGMIADYPDRLRGVITQQKMPLL